MENNNENVFINENDREIKKAKEIQKIRISIAESDEIFSWSSGEVTKPETINYKTHKPEKNGLFDEKIFGPIKDFKCPVCGKKHKRADAGKPCSNCGESIIESKMVRRRKMGHISLATPVAHIWFSKVDYSVIGTLIGIKQDDLDSLLYFKSHIVYDNDGLSSIKNMKMISVKDAASIYKKILIELKNKETNKEIKKEISNKIEELWEISTSAIGQNYGIDFYEYNEFISEYSNVKIGTGSETLKIILDNIDLKEEQRKLVKEINKNPEKTSNLRRIRVIESFLKSQQKPSAMIIDVLPVIPADLRPLIQLDGGRHSTVDVNELYRRIIIRNNRLKQWIAIEAPELIIQNEKRMLQESVDALFDNTRKKNPVNSKDNRPLKSLAENLKGKQGRFRQNLLGKRVDYSGRSVIVVGPELKLHQVGLPKQMVVKLFEPFIVNLLVSEGVARNIKQAKKKIEVFDDKIWKYASRVIKNHPVLLNRAPTLHRLSIQAFEPVITSGKAIRLHPLVTPSFNADFDGDQMAVHVPLSKRAKKEALELMISRKNILGPKDGKLILSPSQDIILGVYYLTKVSSWEIDNLIIVNNFEDMMKKIDFNHLHVHSKVMIPLKLFENKFRFEIEDGYKYLVTTVGRIILNMKLPESFPYINEVNTNAFKAIDSRFLIKGLDSNLNEKIKELDSLKPFKKSSVSSLIEEVFEKNPDEISNVLDNIKELGFKYSMLSGVSIGWKDIIDVDGREDIIKKGDEEVVELKDKEEEGFITDDERYKEVLKVWSNVKQQVEEKLNDELQKLPDNPLFMMMDSGARGSISNFVQLAGMRGSMSKATHEYAALIRQGIVIRNTEEIPIKSSFKIGLTPFEYYLSTHGARKGLSDTATKTAESGYLTRRLVDAVQDLMITEEDCGTSQGIEVKSIVDTRTNSIIESVEDRIHGRYSNEDIYDNNGELIIAKNELITTEHVDKISRNDIKKVNIRTVLTCNAKRGICKKCYGDDLSTNKEVSIGEAIGIISAQSIGEPGTQLTMRTFHTGGVAGVSDITQGFSRLMEILDANKNPKSAAIIAKKSGVVKEISKVEESKRKKNGLYKVVVENDFETITYPIEHQVLRVKVGDKVEPGKKITEGSIKLDELLAYAGKNKTQEYLIKEIQRLYRIQGININDKYMEVIIKQMLSKLQVTNPGDTKFYSSQTISENQFREENEKAFAEGREPAQGKPIILGVKALPLYSESFLAAASYQRTAEALVNASISGKRDNLFGVKESLIVGNKIPVGTGLSELHGKYKIFEDEEQDDLDENRSNKYKKTMDILKIIKDSEEESNKLFD